MIVAFPAVEVLLPEKYVCPPLLASTTEAPLLVMVALPAVELLPKPIEAPDVLLAAPPLLVKVPLAAVELS